MESAKEKLKEIGELIERLKKEVPVEIETFLKFATLTEASGTIDAKHKALINVALAVAAQCKWCIALHTQEAVK